MGVALHVVYIALMCFLIVLIFRLVMDYVFQFARSWQPGKAMVVVLEATYTVTDPPLKLLRRFIPPLRLGGVALDLSFFVLMIIVYILISLVSRLASRCERYGLADCRRLRRGEEEMPLTPEDVRNKQFTTVRLREGYDEDEVDAFLDEVESELTRLLRENEDLRAKLAAATRAAAQNQQQQGMRNRRSRRTAAAGSCARRHIRTAGRSSSPRRWARPSCPVVLPQLPAGPSGRPAGRHGRSAGPRRPGGRCRAVRWAARCRAAPWAVRMQRPDGQPTGAAPQMQQPGQGPGGDSAARVLSLAQQTADQAIAEARSEANKIVGEARSRAEGLERDARAKADALERDAQEKHRVAMGSLESARATLERKVEDLRGFEREYRTRLKSYLESQLRQLETQADDSLAPPRTPATASLPPSPSMAPAGAGAMGHTMGGNQSMGGTMGQPMGGGQVASMRRRPVLRRPAADVAGDDPADGTGAAAGAAADAAGAVADAGLPDRRGRQLTAVRAVRA